jgi:hypothetical protein
MTTAFIMKGVCRRKFVQFLIVPTMLAGPIGPAVACGYDGSPSSGLRHPRAIEVAAALRNASNAQILDRQLVAPAFVNMMGYRRAVRRLQRLRDSLEWVVQAHKLAGPGFSLLLVEAGLWSRYVPDGEGVSIAIHTPGPQPSDALVFTGEAAIEAIASGRLSTDEAFRRGLIVIDGAPGANRDLAALLRGAFAVLAEQI